MGREVKIYGALLLLSLGGAYWASLPTADKGQGEQAVFSPSQDLVKSVKFSTKDVSLTAERRAGDGRYVMQWQRGEGKPESFLSNSKFADLIKTFNPVTAKRILTGITSDQRSEFGLTDAVEKLELVDGSDNKYEVLLGKRGYGGETRFAEEVTGTKRILTIETRLVDGLSRANVNYFDHDVVSFEMNEVTSATIISGDKSLSVLQKARGADSSLSWTLEDEKNNPSLQTWMDRIAKLAVISYSSPESQEKLRSIIKVAYKRGSTGLDEVELLHDGNKFYARSTYLGMIAELEGSKLETVEKDLSTLWPKS